MRRVAALVVGSVLFALGGCDVEDDALEVSDVDRLEHELVPPVALGEPAVFPEAPLVASGRLELLDSPISPYCGAVLVAPDVAVTAASCVAGHYPEAYSVAFGDPSMAELAPRAMVADILTDRDADDPIAVLVLDTPVLAIPAAKLPTHRIESSCQASAVSHEYVAKHENDPGARWLVTGCLEGEQLEALDDAPNCHGEQGSGVFVDGTLVGLTMGMGDTFDGRGCTTALRVARIDGATSTLEDVLAFAG